MNTAAKRAFAVYWWVLVIATIGCWGVLAVLAYVDTEGTWVAWLYAAIGLLPFIAMTLMRGIVAGRWRFGPRW